MSFVVAREERATRERPDANALTSEVACMGRVR